MADPRNAHVPLAGGDSAPAAVAHMIAFRDPIDDLADDSAFSFLKAWRKRYDAMTDDERAAYHEAARVEVASWGEAGLKILALIEAGPNQGRTTP